MVWKFRCCCSCRGFSLKPETNLALVLCLVFYLYVCLGGALFLLLEGQGDGQPLDNTTIALKQRPVPKENLWNFIEATDFSFNILTGQGTGQTTRTLHNNNSKIAYIFYAAFGIPITILTFRATGKRLNVLVYAIIRFINVKIFKRQLTSHIHLKAIIINFIFFVATYQISAVVFMTTQNWNYLDAAFYTANLFFSIGNTEMRVNANVKPNSRRDKALRVAFNLTSFIAYTVLGSFIWSAHLFTRHMRFKAQNNQIARTNGNASNTGTARRNCPWVEVARSRGSSPTKSLCKERETDRESVC
ncbi:potassium channel subfamily K member 15-like [Rhopilema esculentum]|uniref:potassium channel subfamily K member 15-like n=1 Tax=Rhopilema esculentum TaxID=499914 RepID=UPI0031DD62EE